MRFWHLSKVRQNTDYGDSFLNGRLDHPFGLPGVTCDVCGTRWSGCRVLPIECPESLRGHPRIKEGCNVPRQELDELMGEVEKALADQGQPTPELLPGDEFQPCFLDIPSRPRADFLWSSWGTLVVTQRIADVLAEACPEDVTICPVTLRKIGKREAKLPPPLPSTGEPEDIIDEVELKKDVSDVGPYFEVVIHHESGYPAGCTPIGYCEACRRHEIHRETLKFRMTPQMWKGNHIFHMATTLHVVVTDDLKQRLEQIRPTNLVVGEYPVL